MTWADGWIAAASAPSGELCEVALAGRRSKFAVIDLLRAIPGTVDRRAVDGLVLVWIAGLHGARRLDDLEVVRAPCRLGVHEGVDARGRRWRRCFHDELETPELFQKSFEEVRREMLEALSVLTAGTSWVPEAF